MAPLCSVDVICRPADAISKAVDFGRSRADRPVWLIATSLGSIAAVNGGGASWLESIRCRFCLVGNPPWPRDETLFDAELAQ